jgi:hypothetical protein
MPAGPPPFTVSYSKVERALIEMHGISAADILAFRSRFGALQRGGLFGAENQPGKGRRIVYGTDQLHRAVLAFELVQAGIGPSAILRLIADYWTDRLRDIFSKAEGASMHGSSDVILILAGIAMGFGDEATPNVNYVTADKLPERLTFALDGKHLPARAVLVNLSAQLRKFHDALVRYHLQRDDLDRPTPKAKKKPRKR